MVTITAPRAPEVKKWSSFSLPSAASSPRHPTVYPIDRDSEQRSGGDFLPVGGIMAAVGDAEEKPAPKKGRGSKRRTAAAGELCRSARES
jgi:hypothetical protein